MTPNVSGSAVNYLRWNVSGVWEPNSVNGANPSAPLNETQTTVYIAANGGTLNYPGIRYVWYVLDDVNPNYAVTQGMVGFTNVAAGPRARCAATASAATWPPSASRR